MALAGCFYLSDYANDRFRIVPHPETHAARIVDCAGGESLIEPRSGAHAYSLGYVDFSTGSEPGYNPCLNPPVVVQPTTWSALKARYRR